MRVLLPRHAETKLLPKAFVKKIRALSALVAKTLSWRKGLSSSTKTLEASHRRGGPCQIWARATPPVAGEVAMALGKSCAALSAVREGVKALAKSR